MGKVLAGGYRINKLIVERNASIHPLLACLLFIVFCPSRLRLPLRTHCALVILT
jgi:hypothetical protein